MGVTQDEPADGTGDGDTAPDAMVTGSGVLLRAERSGDGDGRLYRIGFIASDGLGESCAGEVVVCVPRSRQAAECGDDGSQYESLPE